MGIETTRAVVAGFLDDELVAGAGEEFAVVPGAVGARGAGIALALYGGLCESQHGRGEAQV